MSEIKPAAWICSDALPSDSYPWQISEMRIEKGGEYTMPLFTLEQLTQAVAAERERCAKLIEDHCERYITERGDSWKELAPRIEGDLAGLTYAEGIRNLGGAP